MPIPCGNGMNTAHAGKNGTAAGKARVALLTKDHGSSLANALTREGHDLVECETWQDLDAAGNAAFDLILCDAATATQAKDADCPVLFVGNGDGTPAERTFSAEAIESGLDAILSLAMALAETTKRCEELESLLQGLHTGTALVGATPVVRRLQGTISRAADCDLTVLVQGPTGSGKSLVARMVHTKSRRGGNALVTLHGGTTTAETLAEALTAARGSTLLIEDVEKLPATAQALLVRNLKERTATTATTAPRIVATTSAHLTDLIPRGTFREDLCLRLHGLPIQVPGLHERVDDIAALAQAALDAVTGGKRTFAADALAHLATMTWPGNVTQLQATVQRAALLGNTGPIGREHLTAAATTTATTTSSATTATESARTTTTATTRSETDLTEADILPFEQEEKRLLTRALRATKGQVRRAAQLLGIGRATLYRKIQEYQLPLR
jgi:DNA-binding NtrC family response regulator